MQIIEHLHNVIFDCFSMIGRLAEWSKALVFRIYTRRYITVHIVRHYRHQSSGVGSKEEGEEEKNTSSSAKQKSPQRS